MTKGSLKTSDVQDFHLGKRLSALRVTEVDRETFYGANVYTFFV